MAKEVINISNGQDLPHVMERKHGLREIDYKFFAPTPEVALSRLLALRLIGVGRCGLAFDYFADFEKDEKKARLVARLDCHNSLGREMTLQLLQELEKKYPEFHDAISFLFEKFTRYYDEKYASVRSQKYIRQAFLGRVAGHNAFFRSYAQHAVPINTILMIGEEEQSLPLLTVTKKVSGSQLKDGDSSLDIPTQLLHAISLGDPKLHNIFRENFQGSDRYTVIDIAKFVPSQNLLRNESEVIHQSMQD